VDITSILGTIFSGGITGIIGSAISAFSSYKLKRMEYDHVEKMFELNTLQIQAQTDRDIKISQLTIEQIEASSASIIKQESYKQDKASYSNNVNYSEYGRAGKYFGMVVNFLLGIVDFLRGVIRPATTIYFEVFMFIMWYTLYNMLDGYRGIEISKLTELFHTITVLILYCATTCILWWFGERQLNKHFDAYLANKR